MVLVDTSVWIEYFKKRSVTNPSRLALLIEERRVVTCRPIAAEILSGEMAATVRVDLSEAFETLISVDLDWNLPVTWAKMVDLALRARRGGLAVPGLVDRMVLLAASESGASLWTLDRKLIRLADLTGVTTF